MVGGKTMYVNKLDLAMISKAIEASYEEMKNNECLTELAENHIKEAKQLLTLAMSTSSSCHFERGYS